MATTQFSEASNSPVLDLESFLMGDSLYRCRSEEKTKLLDVKNVHKESVESHVEQRESNLNHTLER